MSNNSTANDNGYDNSSTNNLYGYTPSLVAAIIFITFFSLLTLAHLGLTIKSRLWWTIVMTIGGITEAIGWIGRALAHSNPINLNDFLIQIICLILAPCFYSAFIYAGAGMMIRIVGTQYSIIKPSLYLWIFCLADLLAIVIQAVGGAMAALALERGTDSINGTHIMVAGICLQLASMIIFCILITNFYFRARNSSPDLNGINSQNKIRKFLFGIFFGSFWILLRCIYRTVELAQGWSGFLITRENYFICLDAVPMVLTMSIFLVCHPYFCLPNTSLSQKNDQSEKYESEDDSLGRNHNNTRGNDGSNSSENSYLEAGIVHAK